MASSKLTYQLKWCWGLSKGYKASLLVYYLAELVVITCSLSFVIFSKRAIDFAIDGNRTLMFHALYWSIALMLFNIIFKTISTKYNELSKMKMLKDLQNEVVDAQMYSSWEYIKRWSTGDIQFRIQRDCIEVVQMITQTFPNFTLTLIRLFASLSLLWVMDSRLAYIILAITPLFLFSKVYYKKFRKFNKELKSKEGDLSHIINENLKFRMLIKTLGIEMQRWKKLSKTQNKILELKTEILNFSMISQTIIKTTVSAGFLFTFIWGVLGLNAGSITFGTMTAFLQLVGRVQNPMLGLLGFFPSFVSFGVSVERVQEIVLGNSEAIEEPVMVEEVERLEISNLNFRYEDKDVLENITLSLKKGESTAILGASGRGKTTLIRLLLSVVKAQTGEVKLYYDGQVDFLSAKYRNNFGYVPQGDKLFSASIRENLVLGDQTISEEDIQKALYNSCSEFVYDLPKGLDTLVGESGYGLSEGQAQRIAIARTLLRDTPIWLFDEVTSSLDNATSKNLLDRLHAISQDKIAVFVTHDIDLAEYCSQIYYMK